MATFEKDLPARTVSTTPEQQKQLSTVSLIGSDVNNIANITRDVQLLSYFQGYHDRITAADFPDHGGILTQLEASDISGSSDSSGSSGRSGQLKKSVVSDRLRLVVVAGLPGSGHEEVAALFGACIWSGVEEQVQRARHELALVDRQEGGTRVGEVAGDEGGDVNGRRPVIVGRQLRAGTRDPGVSAAVARDTDAMMLRVKEMILRQQEQKSPNLHSTQGQKIASNSRSKSSPNIKAFDGVMAVLNNPITMPLTDSPGMAAAPLSLPPGPPSPSNRRGSANDTGPTGEGRAAAAAAVLTTGLCQWERDLSQLLMRHMNGPYKGAKGLFIAEDALAYANNAFAVMKRLQQLAGESIPSVSDALVHI